jgi:hypothetical protein
VIIQVYIGNDLAENAGIIRRFVVRGSIDSRNPTGVLDGNPAVNASLGASLTNKFRLAKHWLSLHSYVYRLVAKGKRVIDARKKAYKFYSSTGDKEDGTGIKNCGDDTETKVATNLHVLDLLSPRRQNALSRAWTVTKGLMARIKEECDKEGAKLLVFLIPHRVQVLDDLWKHTLSKHNLKDSMFDRDLPNRRWLELLDQEGIEALDLLTVYRLAYRNGKNPYEPGGHIGREGHKLTAESIIMVLERLGWFPIS